MKNLLLTMFTLILIVSCAKQSDFEDLAAANEKLQSEVTALSSALDKALDTLTALISDNTVLITENSVAIESNLGLINSIFSDVSTQEAYSQTLGDRIEEVYLELSDHLVSDNLHLQEQINAFAFSSNTDLTVAIAALKASEAANTAALEALINNGLSSANDNLANAVSELRTVDGILSGEINANSIAIASFTNSITLLEVSISSGISDLTALEERLDSVDTALASATNDIDVNTTDIANLNIASARLNSDLISHVSDFTLFSSFLSTARGDISRLETSLLALSNNSSATQSELDSATAGLAAAQSDIASTTIAIQNLLSSITTLTNEITLLEGLVSDNTNLIISTEAALIALINSGDTATANAAQAANDALEAAIVLTNNSQDAALIEAIRELTESIASTTASLTAALASGDQTIINTAFAELIVATELLQSQIDLNAASIVALQTAIDAVNAALSNYTLTADLPDVVALIATAVAETKAYADANDDDTIFDTTSVDDAITALQTYISSNEASWATDRFEADTTLDINDIIDIITAAIDALPTDDDSVLEGQVSSLTSALDALKLLVANNTTDISTNASAIAANTAAIASLTDSLTLLETSVTDGAADLDSLEDRLDIVTSSLNTVSSTLDDADIADILSRIAGLKYTVDTYSLTLQNHTVDIEQIKQAALGMQLRANSHTASSTASFAALEAELNEAQAELLSLTNGVSDTLDSIVSLEDEITRLEGLIGANTASIVALQNADIANAAAQLIVDAAQDTALSAAVTAAQAALATAKSDLETAIANGNAAILAGLQVGLNNATQNLQTEVTALEAAIAANTAAIAVAAQEFTDALALLQAEVDALALTLGGDDARINAINLSLTALIQQVNALGPHTDTALLETAIATLQLEILALQVELIDTATVWIYTPTWFSDQGFGDAEFDARLFAGSGTGPGADITRDRVVTIVGGEDVPALISTETAFIANSNATPDLPDTFTAWTYTSGTFGGFGALPNVDDIFDAGTYAGLSTIIVSWSVTRDRVVTIVGVEDIPALLSTETREIMNSNFRDSTDTVTAWTYTSGDFSSFGALANVDNIFDTGTYASTDTTVVSWNVTRDRVVTVDGIPDIPALLSTETKDILNSNFTPDVPDTLSAWNVTSHTHLDNASFEAGTFAGNGNGSGWDAVRARTVIVNGAVDVPAPGPLSENKFVRDSNFEALSTSFDFDWTSPTAGTYVDTRTEADGTYEGQLITRTIVISRSPLVVINFFESITGTDFNSDSDLLDSYSETTAEYYSATIDGVSYDVFANEGLNAYRVQTPTLALVANNFPPLPPTGATASSAITMVTASGNVSGYQITIRVDEAGFRVQKRVTAVVDMVTLEVRFRLTSTSSSIANDTVFSYATADERNVILAEIGAKTFYQEQIVGSRWQGATLNSSGAVTFGAGTADEINSAFEEGTHWAAIQLYVDTP